MEEIITRKPDEWVGQSLKNSLDRLRTSLDGDCTAQERKAVGVILDAFSLSWKKVGLSPILPLLFQLKGKPYSILSTHFPMAPLFQLYNVPKKRIIKGGRQFSKCLARGTSVHMYPSGLKSIEHVSAGDSVIAYDRDTGKARKQKVVNTYANGFQPCVAITTQASHTPLISTLNHRHLTQRGYVEAEYLRGDDMLLSPTVWDHNRLCDFPVLTRGGESLKDAIVQLVTRLHNHLNTECLSSEEAFGQSITRPYVKDILSQDALRTLYTFYSSHLTDTFDLLCLKALAERTAVCVPIISIRPDKVYETFDIEVEVDHNFIACGVVTHNSTSLAYQSTAHSIVVPHFNTLFVTPLYEQIRRFSQNYVKQAISTCRLQSLVRVRGTQQNVLQRAFPNGSSMFFSFAFKDCERTRGINSDKVAYDEVQGLDRSFIPIINASMDASPYGLEQYSGTPLSKDNAMEVLWEMSSKGEWCIPCKSCGYHNLMAERYDMLKMLGPWDGAAGTGLICAKCGKPVYTRNGYWWHERPHLRYEFEGLHPPQMIFPMHCENEGKWRALLKKKEEDEFTFMTEVAGESWDAGSRLVTQSDLRDAATLPWDNTVEDALANMQWNKHVRRFLCVDWSGGGSKEESLTGVAVLGLLNNGHIEVIYVEKYRHSNDSLHTAKLMVNLFKRFACSKFVHDFGGAGNLREQFMISAGLPIAYIIPVTYVRQSEDKALMTFTPPLNDHVRSSWSLNKARSLLYTCELIKQHYVHFPRWKSCSFQVSDFLALVEETIQTPRGSDIFLIGKASGIPDDCAQAINIGICALYNDVGVWPDLGDLLSPEGKESRMSPAAQQDALGGD